ncbi:MAG TPA: PIG-L deacetylase family protein [Burkholderiales bacterium]|nr:PIG-L deacetylase family protein [Burkholderiales bacterium]
MPSSRRLGVERALVIGAHPDDEVLGCGGLIARLVAEGARVRIIILCGATTSRRDVEAPGRSDRLGESECALAVLGISGIERFEQPDNRLDTVPLLDLIQSIERAGLAWQPDLILTHDPTDLNIDHRIAHQAAITAFRPLPGRNPMRIWAFEVPGSSAWQDPALSTFQPSVYVDIEGHLEVKLRAMQCYVSELRAPPHPRSLAGIETLARWRGQQMGKAAAEAFHLVRETC